jgi:uncharacterized protein YegJ (DUF2314 family)
MKNKIRDVFFLSILCLFLSFCSSNATKEQREGQPDIYNVNDDDEGMNAAIKSANESLGQFTKALQDSNPDCESFSIKVKFGTPQKGGEHIWISDIVYENGNFSGVVGNLPESTTEVKMGDHIVIKKENISDWMYLEKGVLRGGYTILYFRNQLPENERKQFDLENGLVIEESSLPR